VDPVEVHGVGVGPGIDELNPHAVALADTQRRPRDRPVEGPGREEDARGDLNLPIVGHDLELAKRPAVRELADLAPVELRQKGHRVIGHAFCVYLADGDVA